MICLEGLPDGTWLWVVGVITPAGHTSKGNDFMSLAEARPCHGEQRSTMRRSSVIRDPVASGGARRRRLRHLQFETRREGQFLRGASAHALRW
jgi:hypothetical protein